jgi:hypothetical protein
MMGRSTKVDRRVAVPREVLCRTPPRLLQPAGFATPFRITARVAAEGAVSDDRFAV